MVARRSCAFVMPDGRSCRAGPQADRAFCYMHDPEKAAEVAEARRLGGVRRRREGTLSVAYDLEGLGTVDALRRILAIAVFDVLGLENSVARARVLISAVGAGAKLLETGEIEDRLAAIEAAHQGPPALDDAFPEVGS